MTVRILIGHVLDRLRELPDESVHCVVTSPPYYGLRDYGIEPQVWGGDHGCSHDFDLETIGTEIGKGNWSQGSNSRGEIQGGGVWGCDAKREPIRSTAQRGFCLRCNAWCGSLGLEPTLDLYLDHMVEVFRAVRRVMRKDGTCWLNIGDSYAGSAMTGGNAGINASGGESGFKQSRQFSRKQTSGLKPKDLMLIPSRLAIRLQDDGWWVRSDIAWCKKAPMPESCTDRPTTAWEHVFLLTKSGAPTYWTHRDHAGSRTKPEPDYRIVDRKTGEEFTLDQQLEWRNDRERWSRINLWTAHDYFYDQEAVKEEAYTKRNLRNFWLLGPEPFPEAHFATFPGEIPRICIKAGTSERGVCPKCGAAWERVTKKSYNNPGNRTTNGPRSIENRGFTAGFAVRLEAETETIVWQPTCSCNMDVDADLDCVPATVLDPFLGAGTTALLADQIGRNCIGIELNPQYAAMAERRIHNDAPLLTEIAAE